MKITHDQEFGKITMLVSGKEVCLSAAEWAYRAVKLHNAILKTLKENGHLADGENCTLWRLKQAIGRK